MKVKLLKNEIIINTQKVDVHEILRIINKLEDLGFSIDLKSQCSRSSISYLLLTNSSIKMTKSDEDIVLTTYISPICYAYHLAVGCAIGVTSKTIFLSVEGFIQANNTDLTKLGFVFQDELNTPKSEVYKQVLANI